MKRPKGILAPAARKTLAVFLAGCCLFLPACVCPASARTEFTVGQDISREEILDFYYTVDASSYPPFYLRYRFYSEDGEWIFFHETRMGDNWPQTEEDVVSSGTAVLTEDEQEKFFSCLLGGTVMEREDEVIDGDEGPWTYLYWTGDEGTVQEFRFASPEERAEFEAFCAGLALQEPAAD